MGDTERCPPCSDGKGGDAATRNSTPSSHPIWQLGCSFPSLPRSCLLRFLPSCILLLSGFRGVTTFSSLEQALLQVQWPFAMGSGSEPWPQVGITWTALTAAFSRPDLTRLGRALGIGILKIFPGDSNVQPKSRVNYYSEAVFLNGEQFCCPPPPPHPRPMPKFEMFTVVIL